MFGIDSTNLFPGHAMFGHLEDGSWSAWKMHQFTLAKHTLASLQNPTHAMYIAIQPTNGNEVAACHLLNFQLRLGIITKTAGY